MRRDPAPAVGTLLGIVGLLGVAAALTTPTAGGATVPGTPGIDDATAARILAAVTLLGALAVVPVTLSALRRSGTGTTPAWEVGVGVALLCGLGLLTLSLLGGGGTGTQPMETVGVALSEGDPPRPTPPSATDGGGSWLAGLAVLGVLGLLAAGLVLGRTRDPDQSLEPADVDEDDEPEETRAAVAEAAGTAADRLATGDRPVDNVVYRAWHDLTARLAAEDAGADAAAAMTPGEFAAAAVAAGMDPDAVAELTAVFETVRYGDADPTTYADRAQAALRALEQEETR
ncbi:DUF4129 domain-containing protein [Haloarchaeobius amylolyticus]|uniref:DUF4129 domain-containing protein n=1 Tax=Haloarchaeobius amylolyticus TaxID=1198296 RepID=UPI002271065E|nr:DUF4129 domain-containing protein [Haloarchaeobius amylolyticus]